MIIAEAHIRGEGMRKVNFGGGGYPQIRASSPRRVYIRFLEDIGIFRINEHVNSLSVMALFAIRADDDIIRGFARRKPGMLPRDAILVAARRL
jgi:methyl coenzyme M reductase subunit C-like uncharacterized protein (methanogenesis marker protein 7)